MKRTISLTCVFATGLIVACGDDSPGTNQNDAAVQRDAYIGACQDDPVPVFQGDHQSLITSIAIAGNAEGFDLDYDGVPDNLLAPLGTLANSELENSFENGDIFIPMEFFGLDSAVDDDCLNFALYFGEWPPDEDQDGERAGGAVDRAEEDCNDFDADINPSADEVVGDRVDNNCDGWADETQDASGTVIPPTDATDNDGDGFTLAQGDCDDRSPADWAEAPTWWDPADLNPGETEVCGDGLDNDCNGIADDTCDPYDTADGADEAIPLDPASLVTDQSQGLIIFRSGRIEAGHLIAGPSLFTFGLEIEGRMLDLRITSALIEADLTMDAYGVTITDGMLGGVLNGESLDAVPNIAADFFGEEDNTMLDVIVGPGGVVLSFPTIGICRERAIDGAPVLPIVYCDVQDDCGDTTVYRCDNDVRAPDIDVDDDGIEIFLDTNLDQNDEIFRVDTCIDGDGTVYYDTLDASNNATSHCTEEVDGNGNALFVDGYSIAINLTASPITLRGIIVRD